MENRQRIEQLYSLFDSVSRQLSKELLKSMPDTTVLKDCRRQLAQIDKDIRRMQVMKDY